MPAKASFGKRAAFLPAARPAQAPIIPAAIAVAEAGPRAGAFDALHAAGIPIVTCGLMTLLVLVFGLEIHLTGDATFSPSRQTLIALGGINGNLTLGAQEWWRIFTAPLLHGGLTHLIGNCVALFFAGLFLEPMIGAGWFGALFFIAALGGAAGSLAQNDPGLVSVGASGAISGLVAVSLFCSRREKDLKRRRRMQFLSARILIPAVAPIFFPDVATGGTDYGAHAGGALAGALSWMGLSSVWAESQTRPPFASLANGICAVAALLTVGAFVLTEQHRGTYMKAAAALMSAAQMPTDGDEAVRRSAALVNRFPADPRAHYFRALYFYDRHELGDAAQELRTGIAAFSAHADDFQPSLDQTMKMTLALIQKEEGSLDAARDTARAACAASPPGDALLKRLRDEQICP